MPPFKFRLETLLKLRQQQRDLCLGRLQQAEEARLILEQQAESLGEEINATCRQAAAAGGAGAIDVDMLVEFKRYGLVLRAQLQGLAGQRQVVEQEVARRRQELTEADRELKVLEKLKQRRLDEHVRKEHYAEIRQLDEIAQRVARNR